MIFRALFLLWLCFFIFNPSYAFAEWDEKPEFRLTGTYRYDIRDDNHDLFSNRISATFRNAFQVMPFFEARWNIDQDLWERKEAGVEIGKKFCSWFYLGESIEHVWAKEDYLVYADYEKRDYLEAETRLLFKQDLLSTESIKLKGYFVEEYTYDFKEDKATFNELVLGVIMPITQSAELNLNWRHIDRIHYYDSDTLEASLSFLF